MKKSFRIVLIGLFFLLSGCRPDGIVSRDDMASLMADMYLADGCVDLAGNPRQQWDSLDVYGPLLEIHGMTLEEFGASLDYYFRRPDDLLKIYHSVMKRLEAEGKQIGEQEQEEILEGVEEVEEEVTPVWEDLDEAAKPEEERPAPVSKRKNARKRVSKQDWKELEKELEK